MGRAYKEIKSNVVELTTTEYAKRYGISTAAVRRRCQEGSINAFRTSDGLKGSHWKIIEPTENVVDRVEYERLLIENERLRSTISGILQLGGSIMANPQAKIN